MQFIMLTDAKLRYARTLDDDANYVIAGREVDQGPLTGQHAVPARMVGDPSCPPRLASYLKSQEVEEHDPADLFAPEGDA